MSADPHDPNRAADEAVSRINKIASLAVQYGAGPKVTHAQCREVVEKVISGGMIRPFPMNTSFPFVQIANEYHLDYEEVLHFAHMLTYPVNIYGDEIPRDLINIPPLGSDSVVSECIDRDIRVAVEFFLYQRQHGIV